MWPSSPKVFPYLTHPPLDLRWWMWKCRSMSSWGRTLPCTAPTPPPPPSTLSDGTRGARSSIASSQVFKSSIRYHRTVESYFHHNQSTINVIIIFTIIVGSSEQRNYLGNLDGRWIPFLLVSFKDQSIWAPILNMAVFCRLCWWILLSGKRSPISVHRMKGVRVDATHSNISSVCLSSVSTTTTGRFRCEVGQ